MNKYEQDTVEDYLHKAVSITGSCSLTMSEEQRARVLNLTKKVTFMLGKRYVFDRFIDSMQSPTDVKTLFSEDSCVVTTIIAIPKGYCESDASIESCTGYLEMSVDSLDVDYVWSIIRTMIDDKEIIRVGTCHKVLDKEREYIIRIISNGEKEEATSTLLKNILNKYGAKGKVN